MIVLDEYQKSFITGFLLSYRDEFLREGLAVEPIAIKNNLWILPEAVLYDQRCQGAKQLLIDTGHLQNMVIREVDESEYFQYDMEGNLITESAARRGNFSQTIEETSETVQQMETNKNFEPENWGYWEYMLKTSMIYWMLIPTAIFVLSLVQGTENYHYVVGAAMPVIGLIANLVRWKKYRKGIAK